MKHIATAALALAGAFALTTTSASAAIVCNGEGDCWRVKEAWDYRPEFGLRVYGDDWRWAAADNHRYRWREIGEGRGYWHRGGWVRF